MCICCVFIISVFFMVLCDVFYFFKVIDGFIEVFILCYREGALIQHLL